MTGFSGSDVALILTAAGTFVAALASSAAVVLGALNTRKLNKTAQQVEKIEVATNSMKDALVLATGVAAHAAGKVEGRDEVTNELGAQLTIKDAT